MRQTAFKSQARLAYRFNAFENPPIRSTMRSDMRALLALEDGRFFEGESFGATGTRVGEICFNTSMTGYQEVLTDPPIAARSWR